MKIICPYCFKEFQDDEVHFRSEIFTTEEDYPDDFDPEDYKSGTNEILDALMFFHRYDEDRFDPKYDLFWSRFDTHTTEEDPAADVLGIKSFKRCVIDPSNPEHQKYLVMKDGSYLVRDPSTGMVTSIYTKHLTAGKKEFVETESYRRVCPDCHNPLPQSYGRFPVKFTTVIGITGSGKTVYISKLLECMEDMVTNAGLIASVGASSARNFVSNNRVQQGKSLPRPTPPGSFQQPVFYDILKPLGNNVNDRHTFVLYDVAGEIFNDPALVEKFSKYIKKSDGLILLVEPLSFTSIANSVNAEVKTNVNQVLGVVYHTVEQIKNNKCTIPLAVCIPKCDLPVLGDAFGDELVNLLMDDIKGIKRSPQDIKCQPLFNAGEYNLVAKGLHTFLRNNAPAVMANVDTMYTNYAYFAFSVLGCGTDESNCPISVVQPRRIEEPLFWLFHKLGYIGTSSTIERAIPLPKHCPKHRCGSSNTSSIARETDRVKITGWGPFKREVSVDYICLDCGYKWDSAEEISLLDTEDA